MRRSWIFFLNPFNGPTQNSYRNAKKIGDYTLNALKGKIIPPGPSVAKAGKTALATSSNDFFNSLIDDLQPFVNDFDDKYAIWLRQQGDRKGQVSRMADSLALLSSVKIENWELAIRTAYNPKSPEYERLLPNKRKPFQTGSQQARITAVEVLNLQVSEDEVIPNTIKEDINLFYLKLKKESGDSTSEKSDTKTASEELEVARIALCKALYGVLGNLMAYYREDPLQGEAFFDLESIRIKEQSTFRHAVKPNQAYEIIVRQFEPETKVKIDNDGDADLKFYLAAGKGDAPGGLFVTVAAKKSQTVELNKLGSVTNTYMYALNLSETVKGHYVVEFI